VTAVLVSALLQAALGAAPLRITGRVVDAAGATVAGATVRASCGRAVLGESRTGDDGAFALSLSLEACDGPVSQISLAASAPGFAPARHVLSDPFASTDLSMTLHPEGPVETITVTASGRGLRGREGPASVSVLTAADLEALPALMLDDALRLTPGFSLFRRSSSRSANPTTQGATLRGLSASGASRSLVLLDGVPLNDPFGGWIYWSRVPVAAIERVEVARGGASDLYGADAAAGVVQVLTVENRKALLRSSLEGGTLDTQRASAYAAATVDGWAIAGAAEAFRTDGAVQVAPEDRGLVDTPAGSSHRTLALDVSPPRVRGIEATIRGGVFSEDRTNGTPLQVNDTNARHASASVGGGDGVRWRGRVHAQRQGYDQTFSAVADDRASERLTSEQHVPSEAFGGSMEASGVRGGVSWLLGADARDVRGIVTERRFVGGSALVTDAGGRQRTVGGLGQLSAAVTPSLQLMAGARVDGLHTRIDRRDEPVDRVFLSPRAALSWRLDESFTLRGAGYRAFRAPTLNERVRDFRVGNVVTAANPALSPETLTGGEAGLLWSLPRGSMQATFFIASLDDAITNVTVSSSPALVTRERRNAGELRSTGVEVEAGWRLTAGLITRVSAAFIDAAFTATSEGIDGNRVPQVPARQVAVDLRYAHPRGLLLAAQLRSTSSQWEDDRNTLKLGPATVADVMVAQTVGERVRVFVAVENAADAVYDVGRTPLRTIGLPRTVRGGVRVDWD
jgi:outer membrane receptor protein involved in Fe transport